MEAPEVVPEIIIVDKPQIACDGGSGALGHPRVYYTIKVPDRSVDCGYCGRRFTLRDGAQGSNGH